MAENTHIEWTDDTWNPITGCSVVSPGCTNCYAMKLAGTRLRHHPSRAGLTVDSKAGPVWNGKLRFNEQWLDQPMRRKRARMIFVCAHGDLFHENVPDEWIDRVFAVMALSPQHTFQVLTKRSARMRAYMTGLDARTRTRKDAVEVTGMNMIMAGIVKTRQQTTWPLPNVWLGVSAEDQARADERIPDLLDTPAAVRFVSAEPLLGPIDLTNLDHTGECRREKKHGISALWKTSLRHRLDWVIVGGESGNGARPMHPNWVRSLRDQCGSAGVPFFFKQWGNFRPLTDAEHGQACGATLIASADRHDREAYVMPTSKKRAGRLLDGVEHNGMPQVPAL